MEDGGETWHLGKDNKGEESEATGRTDKTVMHVQEERLPCTNTVGDVVLHVGDVWFGRDAL